MSAIDHHDSACGWLERDGAVLLVKNRRFVAGAPVEGWDLPGGRVEPGESLTQAVVREMREEVGLSVEVDDLFRVEDGTVIEAPDQPALSTWRTTFFEVHGEGVPQAGDDIVDVTWAPREQLATYLTLPYHDGLRRYLAGDGRRHVQVTWLDPLCAVPTAAHAIAADGAGHSPTSIDPATVVWDALSGLVAAGAAGDAQAVALCARRARAAGATSARVEECLLQLAPYAGYPRTIAAFAAARDHLDVPREVSDRGAASDASSARGRACFDAVYGDTARRVRAQLDALHPVLAAWIESMAYGRVLAREGVLDLRERELLAVSILAALGGLEGPLLGHMRAAQRQGAMPSQVAASVRAAAHVAPRWALNASMRLLERLPG